MKAHNSKFGPEFLGAVAKSTPRDFQLSGRLLRMAATFPAMINLIRDGTMLERHFCSRQIGRMGYYDLRSTPIHQNFQALGDSSTKLEELMKVLNARLAVDVVMSDGSGRSDDTDKRIKAVILTSFPAVAFITSLLSFWR